MNSRILENRTIGVLQFSSRCVRMFGMGRLLLDIGDVPAAVELQLRRHVMELQVVCVWDLGKVRGAVNYLESW